MAGHMAQNSPLTCVRPLHVSLARHEAIRESMRLSPPSLLLAAALLSACTHTPAAGAAVRGDAAIRTAGLWGPRQPVKPGLMGGPIRLAQTTPFPKDPAFVDDGRPRGGARWIVFGDLRAMWLKAFDVDATGGPLVFRPTELRLEIDGLPAGLDSPWAPELKVIGDRAVLLYSAGAMPAPQPPQWRTFRLRQAEMPLAAFEAALREGRSPRFADRGVIFDDLAPFGPGDTDFGVIDPQLFVNDRGRAFLTYTIVRGGRPNVRPHEEFVRFRRVEPGEPARALGPDTALLDGRAGTETDGVAEAQDIATVGGRTYAFVSIRAGDADQRLVVAEVPRDLGTLKIEDFQPFRYAGAEPWMAKAVGSSGAATIGGTTYLVHQGLGADRRFTLGWTTVVKP